MANYDSLKNITENFYQNIRALRIFNEKIGSFAEQHDKSEFKNLVSNLSQMIGIPENELDPETGTALVNIKLKIPKIDDLEDLKINHENDEENQVAEIQNDNEAPSREVVVDDPDKIYKFIKFMRESRKQGPLQTRLLRQGVLINLMIVFENLIGGLLQFFYLSNPSALPADSRQLSLSELREIGSIENAEKFLIDKEVDAIMRDSTQVQLDAFTKRTNSKVNLDALSEFISELIEVSQRRNLFVHNNGIVNRVYISNISKDLLEKYSVKEGNELVIGQSYITNAIDIICVCGTILTQQAWRKWNKTEESLKTADDIIREYIYELLKEKRWNLVKKVCTYAYKINIQSDIDLRLITINHAIALKEEGNLKEMNDLLEQKDWSSCATKFHVALHALRDQHDEMIETLHKAVAAEEIDEEALIEWPLFRWFRESEDFVSTVEYLFSEDDEN